MDDRRASFLQLGHFQPVHPTHIVARVFPLLAAAEKRKNEKTKKKEKNWEDSRRNFRRFRNESIRQQIIGHHVF